MKNYRFTVFGRPKPMERPRINMKAVSRWLSVKMKGNPYRFGPLVYTPSTSKNYQRLIAKACKHGKLPLTGLVSVSIIVMLTKPKFLSVSRLRPDLDNFVKNVFDGLQESGIIEDDAYINDFDVHRYWVDDKEDQGLEVLITEVQHDLPNPEKKK